MSVNTRAMRVAGRIAVGILLAQSLLPPSTVSAQETREELLERRIAELERAKAAYEEATQQIELLTRRVEALERQKSAGDETQLAQRVEALETATVVNEDATRSIIRQSFSEWGSKINEFVVFGGTIEVLSGWDRGFSGRSEGTLRLDTAELDFEVQVNDWVTGSMVVQYLDDQDVVFETTSGVETGVDRINLDTAFLTIGDTQRFPAFATMGRQIMPFGISTGDPVADVITLEDPLTMEIFETREDAILLGVQFPTPPLAPLESIPGPPPVRPLFLKPALDKLGRRLGYSAPPVRPAPSFTTPKQALPPFTAAVYFFNGDTFDHAPSRGWAPGKQIGATVGYRTSRSCRPYRGDEQGDEPRPHWRHFFCPWTVDVDLDFTSSVFDSQFLEFEYREFLRDIGYVPGMAASIKANLGPMSLVAEWNGALHDATFTDDLGKVQMTPRAWQLQAGYQFGWNPWVDAIGTQGTYVAVGYSESRDLHGAFSSGDRIGNAPRRRFLLSAGEWILDGVRVAVEYSYNVDYSKGRGGTGRSSNGLFSQLTYEW